VDAVYAGSFDPFTNGHLDIYRQANSIFSKTSGRVIVLFAKNPQKRRAFDIDQMARLVRGLGIETVVWDGLVADYCRAHGIEYLVRGLRGTSDYLYEEGIAKFNRTVNPSLKTIYFRGTDDSISSSLVRELLRFKKDVSAFLPYSPEMIK
jgi:pantetheine-phosphate adenylyltransferase